MGSQQPALLRVATHHRMCSRATDVRAACTLHMSGIQDRNHTVDVHAELEAPQPHLLKIARLQLRNDTWAEDVVSETTLTALEKIATFDGRSRLRTWVVAILRKT